MALRVRLTGRRGPLAVDLALDVDAGPTAVIGPNGAGKTTLLRAVAGARLGLEGRVEVGEHLLMDTAGGTWVPPQHRRLAYVPQGYALFPHLTVLDNVAFGCGGRRGRDRAREVLERLDALELAASRPRDLSGGQQQKVALARALATDPALLLFDEPLAALDTVARRSVRTVLLDHLEALARPSLLVTHDVRDVLALGRRGGKVVVIDGGKVAQVGSLDEIVRAPATPFVEELFAEVVPPAV